MSATAKLVAFGRSLVLLVLVAGAVPWLLVVAARGRFGGAAPFHGVPSPADWELARIRTALTDRLSDDTIADVVIRLALVVAWVSVAVIVLTAVAEAIHMVRHRGMALPDIRGIGMSQSVARVIAAGLLVVVPLVSSPTRSTAQDASPLLPTARDADATAIAAAVVTASDSYSDSSGGVAAGRHAVREPGPGTDSVDVFAWPPDVPRVESSQVGPPSVSAGRYVVRPGDSVVGIAQRLAGPEPTDVADYADRLIDLNLGRDMGDGQRFTNAAYIDVGWVLVLPDEPAGATGTAASPVEDARYLVERGDSLWSIAEDELGDPHRWPELYQANEGRRFGDGRTLDDPDLIHPGWALDLPSSPADADSIDRTDDVDLDTGVPIADVDVVPSDPLPPPTLPPSIDEPVAATDVGIDGGTGVDSAATDDAATRPVNVWPEREDRAADRPGTPDGPPVAPAGSSRTVDVDRIAGIDAEDVESPDLLQLGGAAMLSGGVLALLGIRRRRRLRNARPRDRLPDHVGTDEAFERALRAIDAGERLVRVELAVRAVAPSLITHHERVLALLVGDDGALELRATGDVGLPSPWQGSHATWRLPGAVPTELLADAAQSIGPLCPTLVHLGRSDDGRDVYVDLEAVEAVEVGGSADEADAIVAAIAATLAASVLAEVTTLVGVGVGDDVFLEHRHHASVGDVGQAFAAAREAIGSTASQARSTYELRARAGSGETWEPAVVLAGSTAGTVEPPRSRSGLAIVSASPIHGPSSRLAPDGDAWSLMPVGVRLTPVGLRPDEVDAIARLLRVPELDPEPTSTGPGPDDDLTLAPVDEPPMVPVDRAHPGPSWSLLVRLLGPVDVAAPNGDTVAFERSKTRELVAWLATHRDRSTRTAARTALWELDVRDATFANVVSEARRSLARLVEPPSGEEWVGRTMTESLPLHELVRTDADLVAAALDAARVQPPDQAIATLRPAVERIRGVPFEGTSYLWPDAEGLASQLVLLATSAATELAAHCLSIGDIDGVFAATGRGLQVLPGHEELIALRMQAHARFGDRAGVRHEWESYERVINADPWSDGEPSPRLVELRRSLLDPST